MDNWILSIFAVLGIIFIIILIYYLIRRWQNEKRAAAASAVPSFPPPSLMELSGAQCPDYWFPDDITADTHVCKNSYHVPVKGTGGSSCIGFKCIDDGGDGNSRTFTTVKQWPASKKQMKDRCLWRECCGPKKNIPASWIGIEDSCNS